MQANVSLRKQKVKELEALSTSESWNEEDWLKVYVSS